MKILMVAPQPFFEPRGTPFSVLGRLKALSALGHEVDLVTYHLGEDIPIPRVAIHRIPSIFFVKKIPIGPSLTKVFLDGFLLVKTIQMLFRSKYELLQHLDGFRQSVRDQAQFQTYVNGCAFQRTGEPESLRASTLGRDCHRWVGKFRTMCRGFVKKESPEPENTASKSRDL